MSLMPESNHLSAKVMNAWPGLPEQAALQMEQFHLTEKDYQLAKQYLIARGEWLFVYKNVSDKQKIIETANHYVRQDGKLTVYNLFT